MRTACQATPQIEALYIKLSDLRKIDTAGWPTQKKRDLRRAMTAAENRIAYLQQVERGKRLAREAS